MMTFSINKTIGKLYFFMREMRHTLCHNLIELFDTNVFIVLNGIIFQDKIGLGGH